MTHSTLTWFSGLIKPTQKDELFILAFLEEATVKVSRILYMYNAGEDYFVYHGDSIKRKSVDYWAYVPKIIDLSREGKQSQVPEEK